jgi:MFS family permease
MIPTATVNDAPPQLSGVSRFILNAALISKLGNQVLYIAMPIILLRTTGSIDTALLGFSLQTLPYVFSPVLGVLIDRYEPLRMFTIGEAFQLACITVLAFTFRHSIPLALVLLFASSVAAVASSILTSFVLIPSFVSPKALPRVNSYFTGGSQLIGVIGFPLGGVVIAFLGAQTAILADAATFALTITAGLIAPRDALPGRTQAPPLTAIAEGWRFVRADQSMLRLGLALGFTNLGAGCLAVLVLAQAQRAWGWHTSAVGFAMGIDALGAAAGALAGGRRAGQTNLVPGMVITCVGAVLMIPFGADPFLLVGLFIMSFGVGLLNVRSITFRQMRIPGELRGRVNSMLRMLIMGAIPLSAVIQLTMAGLPIWIRLAVPALCAVAALVIWLRNPQSDQPGVSGTLWRID